MTMRQARALLAEAAVLLICDQSYHDEEQSALAKKIREALKSRPKQKRRKRERAKK